jgi:hypothetical protein
MRPVAELRQVLCHLDATTRVQAQHRPFPNRVGPIRAGPVRPGEPGAGPILDPAPTAWADWGNCEVHILAQVSWTRISEATHRRCSPT